MRCSRVENYNNRVAIGKERTRHYRCTGWNVRNLQAVDASSLVGPFLLICPSRTLSRRKASWLRALPKKVSNFSTVEAWVLGSLSLGWSWCSDILLRRPIVLRPRGVLLLWHGPIILWPLYILLRESNYHLLRPRLLVGQPQALRDISRRSSYTSCSLLLHVMKTKVFFHGNSIMNQLVKILKTTA